MSAPIGSVSVGRVCSGCRSRRATPSGPWQTTTSVVHTHPLALPEVAHGTVPAVFHMCGSPEPYTTGLLDPLPPPQPSVSPRRHVKIQFSLGMLHCTSAPSAKDSLHRLHLPLEGHAFCPEENSRHGREIDRRRSAMGERGTSANEKKQKQKKKKQKKEEEGKGRRRPGGQAVGSMPKSARTRPGRSA